MFGWKILEFPRLMLQALHHAVWSDRKGRFVDVTRDVRNWKQNVFSPDPASVTNLGMSVAVLLRFFNISGLDEVDEAIDLSLRLTEIRLKGLLPNGVLRPLDETDPIVQNLTGRAMALLALAQTKVATK